MNIIRRIFLSLCLLALAYNAMAVAKNPVKSGDWNDPTVWNGGTLPASGDAVTINGGFTVVVDGSAAVTCASLTVGTAAVVGVLQMGESNPGIYIGAGNLTVGGAVQVAAMGSLEANPSFGGLSFLTINNGGVNGLKITAGGYFNMAPSSTDVCDVVFTGTASTITGACTFYSLIVNSSGIVTCASNETVDSNVVVEGGTLAVAATTLSLTSGNVYVGGAPGESIGTGAVTISSGTLSLDSLTVYSGSSMSVTTTGKLEPTGDVDNMGSISYSATGTFIGGGNIYNNGTLSCKSTIMNLTGSIENYGTGTISLSTGQLKPGGALIQESMGSITYTAAGTITTTGDLDISSGSIITTTGLTTVGGNLNLSGSGKFTPSGVASLTVDGNSSIANGTSVILANGIETYTSKGNLTLNGTLTFSTTTTSSLLIGGNYNFGGTFTAGNLTTVTFNGASPQTILGPNITYYKLTVSNAVSLLPGTTAFTVSNTFLISPLVGTFDVGTNDITCGGTMTNSNVTASSATSFNAEGQTVNCTGAGTINGAQQFTFNNLIINSGTGNTVAEAGTHLVPSEIVNGNLTIASGTLSVATNTAVEVIGNFINGDTYTAITNGALDVGSNFTNNGTFNGATGTVLMNSTTANQTIGGTSATTFHNLTVTNTGAATSDTVDLAQSITVAASLNVTNGAINCSINSITSSAAAAADKFTLAAGTAFIVGDPFNPTSNSTFPSGFGAYTLTGTVIYENDGNAGQMIYNESTYTTPAAITYGTLDIFTGSASSSSTLSNSTHVLTVTGNLTIGDGINSGTATFASSTSNITVDGNLLVNNNGIYASGTATTFIEGDFTVNNNAGFTPSTGTITMSGTAGLDHTQNIDGSGGSQTFYNLTCSNAGAGKSVLLGYPITVNNTLSITVGSLDVSSGNNYQITCNGGFANAVTPGLLAEQGTVLFTPTASVNISGAGQTTFYNLNISPAATFSVTVTGTHATPMEVVGNELNVMTGTFAIAAKGVTVDDSVTISSGATFSIAAAPGKLSVVNSINNSGTITFTGNGNLTTTAAVGTATASFPHNGSLINYAGATYTGFTGCSATIGNSLFDYSATAMTNSTGTFTVADSVYIASGASITFSGAGALHATGDIYNNGAITFPAAGVGTVTASNLFANNPGTVTMNASTATISGSAGNGNVTIASGGAIIYSTGALKLTGNFTDNGTYTEGTGTVTMNSTIANQTISGTASPISFYSLTETNTAPAGSNTVTMQAPIEVDANLDVTSGQFNSYIYAINATHTLATATFTLAAGTTFLIGDPTNPASPVPAFPSGFKTYTFPATSTVIYQADAAQILQDESYVPAAINYGNLDIYTGANSAGTTLSNAIAFTILGNLNIGDGASAGTATLTGMATAITVDGNAIINSNGAYVSGLLSNTTIKGNFTVNNGGVFTPSTGTITMAAAAAVNNNINGTASSLTFNNLTVNNTVATTSTILGYPVTTNGTLTITKGILDVNSAGNYQLTCNGNFTNNVATTGLNAESGTVVFSPVGAVNIAGTGQTNFFNLEINPSVGITVQITGTHAAPNEIVGNELSVMAGTFGLRGTTLNVTDSTTVSSGATITGSIAGWTLNSTNDVYSSGNITSSAAGTLTANNLYANAGAMAINTSTVTLSGGGENSNGGVVIASGATITFTSGALNVSGNFTNNNSTAAFTAGTSTTTFNGASTQVIGGTATTTFHNVAISSYNTIITHNENAGGTFTITGSGTFDCGSSSGLTMSVTGLFTNGGTLLGDAGTLALSNSLTNNGAITATNGNINLNGVSGTLTNNGTITAASSNINFNAATGTLTNNATFNSGTGTVNFNAAGGVLNGTAAISLYNLALTNGVLAITTDLAASPAVINPTITNVLTLTGASSRLNAAAAGDSITMVSTPASSARIAPVTTGAQINLPFTMQRYVGGSLANYEGLASPSQASTLYDWAYDPGFYMSGVGGPDGNAGSFKSVYTIDETTDAYVAVTTTAQALTPGLGLYIYQATTLSSFTPFTFATHGTPSYGVVTFGITDNNTGSNLVGNPYDCPLDWKLLQGDAANAGKLGTQFSVFDRTLGNWESSDGTTASCAGCQLAAAPDIIPEHQGFLVSALSNTSITFNEADKSLTDEIVYKPFTGITKDFVKITLSNNMNGYQGNTAIEFNNKSKASYVLGEDVLYMKSLTQEAPVLYTLSSDGKFLNRNLQPMVDGDEQDVMFYAGGNIAGNYTLTFNGIDNLSQFNCIQLEDVRLGKTVQIEEGSSYTYQLDNTGTYKFILHFKKLQPGLPCVITTLANNVTENLDEAVDVYKSQTGVTAKFTLSESQQAIISVYNTLGQKVEQDIVKDVMDEQVDIPLPSTNGMYIIRIETPGGVTTKRVYQ